MGLTIFPVYGEFKMMQRRLLGLGYFFFLIGQLVFAGTPPLSQSEGSLSCHSIFGSPLAVSSSSASAYTVPSFDPYYAPLDLQVGKSFQDTQSFEQKLNRHNILVPENEAFILEVEKHTHMILDFLQGHSSVQQLPYQGLAFLKDLQESMKVVRSLSLRDHLDAHEKSVLKYHRQSYHSFLRKLVILQERIQKAKESGFRLYPVIHAAHYYLSLISMDRSLSAHGSFEYHIDMLNYKMGLFFDKAKGFAPRVIFTMKKLNEEDFVRIRFSGVTLIQVNRFHLEDDRGEAVAPSLYAEHDWEHGLAMVTKDQALLSHIGWNSFVERSRFFDLRMKYFLNYLRTNMPKQAGFVNFWLFAVLHDEAQTLLDPHFYKFTRDVLKDQLSASQGVPFTKAEVKTVLKQFDRWFENRWSRKLHEKMQDFKYKHLSGKEIEPEKESDQDLSSTVDAESAEEVESDPPKQVGLTID